VSTTDRLNAILAKCNEIIAGWSRGTAPALLMPDVAAQMVAMARSTIAAIEGLQPMAERLNNGSALNGAAVIIDTILAAWPEELL